MEKNSIKLFHISIRIRFICCHCEHHIRGESKLSCQSFSKRLNNFLITHLFIRVIGLYISTSWGCMQVVDRGLGLFQSDDKTGIVKRPGWMLRKASSLLAPSFTVRSEEYSCTASISIDNSLERIWERLWCPAFSMSFQGNPRRCFFVVYEKKHLHTLTHILLIYYSWTLSPKCSIDSVGSERFENFSTFQPLFLLYVLTLSFFSYDPLTMENRTYASSTFLSHLLPLYVRDIDKVSRDQFPSACFSHFFFLLYRKYLRGLYI